MRESLRVKMLAVVWCVLGAIVAGAVAGSGRLAPVSNHRDSKLPATAKTYEVKGVLREIRKGGSQALIAHEDIPGYMEAMTMALDVKDTNELAGLHPGDALTFRMVVTSDDGWIDRVKRIGTSVLTTVSSAPGAPATLMEELESGAPLPDCVLTNQLGQSIRLSDFKGRALAFTFIFTRCPFPVYCPRMNGNLAAAQRQLAASNTGTNWHLISISFDPEFDTPACLAKYAEGYQFDPAHWSFATGATEDIRKLGGGFGLMFWRDRALFNHNVRTVVVDAGGMVQKVFAGNEWKPEELVEEMRRAMGAKQ
ncbi:MAG TPA: SCO family protein [Verrucomicrobiae bacterium]|nr:SCO family protein [Verrucomicrobiae bacterium]